MAHENSKDSPADVNEDVEFDSLDDLPPADLAPVKPVDRDSDPDDEKEDVESETELETTPIREIVDAEEFDDLDVLLAETMPMPPRESLDGPGEKPADSSKTKDDEVKNETGSEKNAETLPPDDQAEASEDLKAEDETEVDDEIESPHPVDVDEAKSRGDAVPVPSISRIANSVSRLREAREAEANESAEKSDEIESSDDAGQDLEDEKDTPTEVTKESETKVDSKKNKKSKKKTKADKEAKKAKAEKDAEPEPEKDLEEAKPDKSASKNEESVATAPKTNPKALVVADDESGEDDDDDDGGAENPISASMREASARKKVPVETAAVFLVDEAADRWIEEDLSDASAPVTGEPVSPRKPNANSRRSKRKSSFLGKVAMLFFVCFLLLAAVAVGAWFSRGYLIAKAENLAIQKLEEQGLPLSYEGRSFKFPRGLILTDVTIFEDVDRTIPKLKVGNFGIDLDVWHLLSTRSVSGFEAVITMEDATAIPFQDGEEICQVTGINADFFATRERLKINRLRGTLNGLDFDVEGLVNLPEPEEAEAALEADDTSPTPTVAEDDSEADAGTEEPVLDFEFLRAAIEPIAFGAAEGVENPVLRIKIDLTPDLMLYADGRLSGNLFTWQGIPFDHAGITFNYSEKLNVVDIIDAQLGFGGGTITAKTQVLIDQSKLANLALTSNADLIKLASYFNPDIKQSLGGIEFIDSPVIEANGSYDLNDPMASILTLDYQHWKGISIPVGENFLPISGLNGQVELRGGSIRTTPTSRLRAEIFGGDIEIRGGFQPQDEPIVFSGTLAASRLPVEKLAALTGETDGGITGLLSADYRGKFSPSDLSKLNGSGDIQIDDGKLYSVPVIGEIQKLLATAVPIFGNRERSALKAHFDVMTGIFITNDLVVRSDATQVKVGGKYNMNDQTTAFKAKAGLDGPLGIAAGLPKEMQLVVEGSGPVANPEIKLSGLPDGVTGLVNDLLGNGETAPPTEDPETETPKPEEAPTTEGAAIPGVVPEIPVVPEIVPLPQDPAAPAAGPPPPPGNGN